MPDEARLPEPEARRRVMLAIIDHPGLHVRGLARLLDIAPSLVEYHAAGLLDAALITEANIAGYRRFYPRPGPLAPRLEDTDALALLREPVPLRLVLELLSHDAPRSHTDLTASVGTAKSTVSFHLAKLTESGVVARDEDGSYLLVDADHTRHLVLRHRPPPELMDDVWATWLEIFRRA